MVGRWPGAELLPVVERKGLDQGQNPWVLILFCVCLFSRPSARRQALFTVAQHWQQHLACSRHVIHARGMNESLSLTMCPRELNLSKPQSSHMLNGDFICPAFLRSK